LWNIATEKTKKKRPRDPTATFFGEGELNKRTGKPKLKRGRIQGSKRMDNGSISAPTGTQRPTPMKFRLATQISPETNHVSHEDVKDARIEDLESQVAQQASTIRCLTQDKAKLEAEYSLDLNAFSLKEHALQAELRARKTIGKLYLSIAKHTTPELNDDDVYTEFPAFISCKSSR
jgi:uncharacterized coiled-coil protein SlyX